MNQKPIREWNGVQYPKEEGAAIIKELNDRTQSDKAGYNSIAELAEKLAELETRQEPTAVENEYVDIPDMLGKQGQQTSGLLQYVADATLDPNTTPGTYAYYEKLATNTAALTDYRLLTQHEVDVILLGAQKVKDQYGNEIEAKLAVIYGLGFAVELLPGGAYGLKKRNIQRTIKTSGPILPSDNGGVIFLDGTNLTITFNPNLYTYPPNFEVFFYNQNATDADFVFVAKTGWTYDYEALTLAEKARCAMLRVENTDKLILAGNE